MRLKKSKQKDQKTIIKINEQQNMNETWSGIQVCKNNKQTKAIYIAIFGIYSNGNDLNAFERIV